MSLEEKIKAAIRDIPNFPKEGIIFKDITPILLDANLCDEIVKGIIEKSESKPDAIVGIESRGFLFGPMLANYWKIPFVLIRKKGKLPGETIEINYDLEYGNATIQMHKNHLKKGMKVMVHDDLLATGGTAEAAASLVKLENCDIHSFTFLINLSFLNGAEKLNNFNANILSLVDY